MFPTGLCIGALLVIYITHWIYKRINPTCNGKLPPGSMGWPLLGETLAFFTANTTSDISPFIKEKMKKYGPIFRTNLVGRPIIISTDSDLNLFIFQQEGKLFESSYPDTVANLCGVKNIGSVHGFMHKNLRNMVLNVFGQESMKKMLPDAEEAANRYLKRWSVQETVEMREAAATMIFDVTAKKLISYDSEKSPENLRDNFKDLLKGLMSFPLNFPGTAYSKSLKGTKKTMKMLKNLLQDRRESPRKQPIDFFDYVLKELDQREDTNLTEEIALSLMFVLLFASHESTSMAISFGLKYLVDNPLVLKELTEEHDAIIRRRENPDSGFTWNEYKSMKFTFQFINETVRLANIAPGIFRKALKDVKFQEYTIPAGWAVMACPPAVHLNPDNYKDPLDFNPWRWEGMESNGASKNFMAFGGGMRFCIGADLAKVQMAVFFHCLVTKYKCQLIRGGDTLRNPGLQFPNGLHIQISEKNK